MSGTALCSFPTSDEWMFETQVKKDAARMRGAIEWDRDSGNDLQLARKVVGPANAGTDDEIAIVFRAVPRGLDERVESFRHEPDDALRGVDRAWIRGCAEVPVRDEMRRDDDAHRDHHLLARTKNRNARRDGDFRFAVADELIAIVQREVAQAFAVSALLDDRVADLVLQ